MFSDKVDYKPKIETKLDGVFLPKLDVELQVSLLQSLPTVSLQKLEFQNDTGPFQDMPVNGDAADSTGSAPKDKDLEKKAESAPVAAADGKDAEPTKKKKKPVKKTIPAWARYD